MKKWCSLVFVGLVTCSLMLTGCASLTVGGSTNVDPYQLGRDIALAHYLTKDSLSEDAQKAVRTAWHVFDAVVGTSPSNSTTLKSMIKYELARRDLTTDQVYATTELIFRTLDNIDARLDVTLQAVPYAEAIRQVHRGITSAIIEREGFDVLVDPIDPPSEE